MLLMQSRTHTFKSPSVEPVFKPVSDPEPASMKDKTSMRGASGWSGEDLPRPQLVVTTEISGPMWS